MAKEKISIDGVDDLLNQIFKPNGQNLVYYDVFDNGEVQALFNFPAEEVIANFELELVGRVGCIELPATTPVAMKNVRYIQVGDICMTADGRMMKIKMYDKL